MRLRVGERIYELATRALVLAVVDAADPAAVSAALADGADVVDLSPAVVAGHDGPGTVEEVRDHLVGCAKQAVAGGTPMDAIVIDPGLERGKSRAERDALLARAGDLAALGYPLLCTCETPAEMAVAVVGGCRILRTTLPRQARRVADVIAAILEAT